MVSPITALVTVSGPANSVFDKADLAATTLGLVTPSPSGTGTGPSGTNKLITAGPQHHEPSASYWPAGSASVAEPAGPFSVPVHLGPAD